jgi:hypothetical protein
MAVQQEIARIKASLIARATKRGLSENFGQREVRRLEDKYADRMFARDGVWAAIDSFREWCMTYTGK